MCLKIYELDLVYFVSAPGLSWQACLKETKVELELLTGYDMLLMIEKGKVINDWKEVEFVNQLIGMLKQIINIWKIIIKTLSHDL